MALEQKLVIGLRQTQQLVMTPQLQQAIKLLQLNQLELRQAVRQELMENPVLEEVLDEENQTPEQEREAEGGGQAEQNRADGQEPAERVETTERTSETQEAPSAEDMVGDVDWESYIDSRPQTSPLSGDIDRPPPEENHSPSASLAEHLRWQLGFAIFTDEEREVATLVIGNLNENGYLEEELSTIAQSVRVSIELAESVLRRVQEFDPVGVASRSLKECLLVQARIAGVREPLVLAILEHHLELLQRRDFRTIAKLNETTIEEVNTAAHVIASFEPRPGRQFNTEDPIYIEPDIFVHKVGDEYHVVLNEDGMPRLLISAAYRKVLHRKAEEAKETLDYVRERLRSATFMIKSIHMRQRTIVKVMDSIVRFQRDFFDRGSQYLRPLNLRDVAEDIEMHESTVSRVTTNKYVQTPHGIFELKFFFNSSIQTADGDSIASESVKEKIREIIRDEDPKRPLSDQRIAEVLREWSIHIARRTVTKYRESMRILASTARRQFS